MPNPQNISHRLNQMSSLVANQINAMLAYWDTDLVCRFANDAYLEWFGKTKEEMIDRITLDKLLGPILYEKNLPYITEALKGNKQVFEREIPTPDGKSSRHSLATYFPDMVNGAVKGFFVHVADVSYIKQLEAMLSKLRLDMLREVIETQETERAYISNQLRDSVNQTLTHCKLLLQAKKINDDESATDKIMEQGIEKAIQELNILSTNLIPSVIQDFGFITGTRMYIESNSHQPVQFNCKNKEIEELSLPFKLSLFRIIQSFLSMVIEQKNENAVRIQVKYVNKNIILQLSIADENFIFQKDNKQFTDIKRRVEYYDGHLDDLLLEKERKLFIDLVL